MYEKTIVRINATIKRNKELIFKRSRRHDSMKEGKVKQPTDELWMVSFKFVIFPTVFPLFNFLWKLKYRFKLKLI